mgnify:CR=1 FL=1
MRNGGVGARLMFRVRYTREKSPHTRSSPTVRHRNLPRDGHSTDVVFSPGVAPVRRHWRGVEAAADLSQHPHFMDRVAAPRRKSEAARAWRCGLHSLLVPACAQRYRGGFVAIEAIGHSPTAQSTDWYLPARARPRACAPYALCRHAGACVRTCSACICR